MRKFIVAAIMLVGTLATAHERPLTVVNVSGWLPVSCDSDIVATSGNIRLTLPAAPATDGCDIVLINGDSGAGKYLIGFPADINPKLYPNQAVGITSLSASGSLSQSLGDT
ncbi:MULTISPECIES: hypothetical protein [unclassified Bradyrhizobium]|uniref:hypothetical protein n=1 Tax=unclassified Bradyrhizobium TaxID=2631580 RepID=UPI0028E22AFA|nr:MULTISPECIES: hypothetical protein [unclassified Bradyrhizobium]